MPQYRYRFKNQNTGRINSATINAFDEQEARTNLLRMSIEVIELQTIPEDPATENQIYFLVSLGHYDTEGLTKREASALIENSLKKRDTAERHVFDLARTTRTETTKFDSKSAIYCKIHANLKSKSEYDLACWYVFRVYRSSINKGKNDGIYNIYEDRFRVIALSILDRPKLLNSLKRAANASETGFRWFGSFVSDGMRMSGESTESQVYKFVFEELRKIFPDDSQRNVYYTQKFKGSLNLNFDQKEDRQTKKDKRNLTLIWIILIAFFVIGWVLK